jgi:hypothetical protein
LSGRGGARRDHVAAASGAAADRAGLHVVERPGADLAELATGGPTPLPDEPPPPPPPPNAPVVAARGGDAGRARTRLARLERALDAHQLALERAGTTLTERTTALERRNTVGCRTWRAAPIELGSSSPWPCAALSS